ncbi:MAG: hypothetical protein FJ030_04400, partial [Chloroflexi bacterium]|nr:hypothetical protein [Chloroflexota bacterium]
MTIQLEFTPEILKELYYTAHGHKLRFCVHAAVALRRRAAVQLPPRQGIQKAQSVTARSIEFEILSQGVFGDANQFRNLRMGQPMRFQPQRVHAALDERSQMPVAMIVQLFQNLGREFKLDRHRQNHTRGYASLSQKPQFVPALGITLIQRLFGEVRRLEAEVERLKQPPPTSHNSSQPPSRDWKADRPRSKRRKK